MLRSLLPPKFTVKFVVIFISCCVVNGIASANNVDDFLLAKMREHDIPGLQLAVIQHNKVVKSASYGIANIQDDVKVDKDTVFNIASMTKAFTCVAVMQLVEQGKVDLHASISTYIEGLPTSWKKSLLIKY